MTDAEATSPTPEPQVVFRGKKRKAYRQRTETDDHNDATPRAATPAAPSHNGTAVSATGSSVAPTDLSAAASIPAAVATSPRRENGNGATATATALTKKEEGEEEKGLSVAEVLRLRNARKSRLGGVKFSAADSIGGSRGGAADAQGLGGEGAEYGSQNDTDDLSLMIREEENRVVERSSTAAAGVNRRFAPQTGLSGELINKHMEQYIEAELAKRHSATAATLPSSSSAANTSTAAATSQFQHDRSSSPNGTSGSGDAWADKIYEEFARSGKLTAARLPSERHTALQGKLLEVDLGDEVRNRNAALTERAARRLLGGTAEDRGLDDDASDDDELPGDGTGGRAAKKVRLGRDGKPWRPRNRRGSDDVKRDRIVEELLRENRFDVYENPIPPPGASSTGDKDRDRDHNDDNEDGGSPDPDEAADDRIAKEFRREFMEAMAERRQRRRAPLANPHFTRGGGGKRGGGKPGAKGPGAKDDGEILRGPKLGGSRNARAAMRDILLKQEREKAAAAGGSSAVNARRGGRAGGTRRR